MKTGGGNGDVGDPRRVMDHAAPRPGTERVRFRSGHAEDGPPPPSAPVSEVEIARGGRGTNRSGDFDRSGLRGLMRTHRQRGQPTVVSDMWDTSGHAWTRHPRLAGARRIPSIATCTAKKRPGGRIERIETER